VQNENNKEQVAEEVNGQSNTLPDSEVENCTYGHSVMSSGEVRTSGAITDEDVVQVRKEERKKVMETG
jgi:hypothetical protein